MRRLIMLAASLPAVVGMCQGGHVPHVVKPQRLNVVMTQPYPQWVATCNRWGGEPIEYMRPIIIRVCENVDY